MVLRGVQTRECHTERQTEGRVREREREREREAREKTTTHLCHNVIEMRSWLVAMSYSNMLDKPECKRTHSSCFPQHSFWAGHPAVCQRCYICTKSTGQHTRPQSHAHLTRKS
eukprot:05979_1